MGFETWDTDVLLRDAPVREWKPPLSPPVMNMHTYPGRIVTHQHQHQNREMSLSTPKNKDTAIATSSANSGATRDYQKHHYGPGQRARAYFFLNKVTHS
jgi:hypothetical protein